MSEMRDAAMTSKAWPFEEARAVLKRYAKAPPEKGYVLPHIGTFGEVLRTTMIKRAFEEISDIPTKLICFSDDLDGMRKVPGNVPQQEISCSSRGQHLMLWSRGSSRLRPIR